MKSICIQSFSGLHFPAFGVNTPYLSVFSPNMGKYGAKKLRIRSHFTQCKWLHFVNSIVSNYYDFNTRLCCSSFPLPPKQFLSNKNAKRKRDIRIEGTKSCSKSAIKILWICKFALEILLCYLYCLLWENWKFVLMSLSRSLKDIVLY